MATRLTQDPPVVPSLEELDGKFELYDGELREKPPMSLGHAEAADLLMDQLKSQLDRGMFRVRQNSAHLAIPNGNSYIPDVVVVPVSAFDTFLSNRGRFERYADPMPLVVEIWSPSTGVCDIDRKIPGYQQRGDLEIWRVHPFDRVVTIWRRQDDGRYVESESRGGPIALHALPDVTIDLDALWA